jgi:hypothetical protein
MCVRPGSGSCATATIAQQYKTPAYLGVVHSLLARSVSVQVCAHVLHLELKLLLGALLSPLPNEAHGWKGTGSPARRVMDNAGQHAQPTLNAMCSKKCAVPLLASVSKRVPLSIHTPTVAVWPGQNSAHPAVTQNWPPRGRKRAQARSSQRRKKHGITLGERSPL